MHLNHKQKYAEACASRPPSSYAQGQKPDIITKHPFSLADTWFYVAEHVSCESDAVYFEGWQWEEKH